MSWRKVTESDLVASLAQNEVEAYRTSGDFEHDPVEQQIAAAVAYEKACLLFDEIRKGDYIPESGDETDDAEVTNDRATAPSTGKPNPYKRLLD